MGSVRQWHTRSRFDSRSSHSKDSKKWYMTPSYLTLGIIRYGSRVKWSNPRNRVALFLYHGVVAIEKEAFGLLSTTVADFYLYR